MQIDKISGLGGMSGVGELSQGSGIGKTEGPSFANLLEKHISEVNDMLNVADKKNVELAVGKTENMHEAMIAVEKAETALKLMVQVRNKAMEAYNEIMRMQV